MSMKADNNRVVAITGASGLLGRYLCDYFSDKGWTVNAMVRDIKGYPWRNKGIRVFKCNLPDVVDTEVLKNVDVLIHCAYMTRFTNLEEARRVNEEGTIRLYELAKESRVKKFVFISSMAARSNAQSYYAQSKYRLVSMMDTSRDLIIRPGLVLANDGGLFSRIVNQVKRLPVIPVFGGGTQILYTIHIEDLCRVIGWAIKEGLSGVITVAESEGITMKDLLITVMDALGQKKLIVSVPATPVMWFLRFFEFFKIKLPVSSESLRGLLNREGIETIGADIIRRSGIRIRLARESIKDIVKELK